MDISRRSFMMMGAAAAVVPSVRGAEKTEKKAPVALGGPLGKEGSALLKKAKFTPLEIAVGAETPFKAIHCSDTHLNLMDVSDLIGAKVEQDLAMYEGRRTQHNPIAPFAACVLRARLLKAPLLHTGDVCDLGTEANFDLVQRYFGEWKVFGCVGNHEFEVGGKSAYGDPGKIRPELAKYFPFDPSFSARIVNGVNFVCLDNVFGGVTERQVAQFAAEEAKGLPIVLAMHVPFFTPFILTAKEKFWRNVRGFDGKVPEPRRGDHKVQLEDPVTRAFIAHLKEQPLLKAILTGHLHIDIAERFSPTAMQYVVGGNYLFHASEILFT